MAKIKFRGVFTTALLLVGTTALTYPFAAQWIEQYHQTQTNVRLADATKSVGPEEMDRLRQEATEYNSDLAEGRATIGDPRYLESMKATGTEAIGRLRVPSINLDQPVFHTMEEKALLAGVGHADGSSMPVGGEGTHTVLGGHRGLAESVGFTHLPKVKMNDLIYVESLGQVMTYRVVEMETLEPMDAAVHPIEHDRDLVTLLTCTPLGVNSHRFVVTAERVLPGDDVEAGLASDQPGFPWWIVAGAGGLIVSVGIGAFVNSDPKPRTPKTKK